MINPFVIDRPVPRDKMLGRSEELERVLDQAEGGHNTLLTAPRRYGKTSLLDAAVEAARARGMSAVEVDFFGVVTLDEAAVRIEEAYRDALQGPLQRWYAAARRAWSPSVRVGAPGASASITARSEPEATRLVQRLLDLPVGIFERSGRRTLVVFDEFQDLLSAEVGVDGLVRSRIQPHREEAAYVFAGSSPGMMAELFGDRERPLYGQARPLRLGPFDDGALSDYIGARFEETGREAGAAMEPLLDLTRGHPQRSMLTAHHLWEATPARGSASEEAWATALETMFAELQEGFERMWEARSPNQRRSLAAVAWTGRWGGGETLYSNATLERFKLKRGTARDVTGVLLRQGELEEEGGSLRLVDPVLEAWIASGRRPLR